MTTTETQKCPRCGKTNGDNWPLDVAGNIVEGGCQDCWEAECSASWWTTMRAYDTAMHADGCRVAPCEGECRPAVTP